MRVIWLETTKQTAKLGRWRTENRAAAAARPFTILLRFMRIFQLNNNKKANSRFEALANFFDLLSLNHFELLELFSFTFTFTYFFSTHLSYRNEEFYYTF